MSKTVAVQGVSLKTDFHTNYCYNSPVEDLRLWEIQNVETTFVLEGRVWSLEWYWTC